MKKNYWDTLTGKVNTYAVVQAAPDAEKHQVFLLLLEYFGYDLGKDGLIAKRKTRS
jgi:hypothetical protein